MLLISRAHFGISRIIASHVGPFNSGLFFGNSGSRNDAAANSPTRLPSSDRGRENFGKGCAVIGWGTRIRTWAVRSRAGAVLRSDQRLSGITTSPEAPRSAAHRHPCTTRTRERPKKSGLVVPSQELGRVSPPERRPPGRYACGVAAATRSVGRMLLQSFVPLGGQTGR